MRRRVAHADIQPGAVLIRRNDGREVFVLAKAGTFRGEDRWLVKGAYPGARTSTIGFHGLYRGYEIEES